MEAGSDTQSVNIESSDTNGEDPTTNNIHSGNSNTAPEIDNNFADSSNKYPNSDNNITKTNWNLPKNVQQPLTKQHPLYKIAHGLIQNQQLLHAAMKANPPVLEALQDSDWDAIPQTINSTCLVNDTDSAQHNDIH